MFKNLQKGSVIYDLAAVQEEILCSLKLDKIIEKDGVKNSRRGKYIK